MDLKELKSGSDVRGVALGGEGRTVTLTDEAVKRVAAGFCLYLAENGIGGGKGGRPSRPRAGKRANNPPSARIVIGNDGRLSAGRITAAAAGVLRAGGYAVCDCGLSSTPSIFMMTKYPETDFDAGVMVTASHHPADRNGLKFFTKRGGLESADISRLLELAGGGAAADLVLAAKKNGGAIPETPSVNPFSYYKRDLTEFIRRGIGRGERPLTRLKIAVDAGNGAAGFYADILADLGADVSASQFLEPDGRFPNHAPNPEDSAAIGALSRRVSETGADLGVIFDADGDRAAVVDGNGREVNRNRLIALVSAILLRDEAGATIVTDSVASDGLREFIEAAGGRHRRFKRGYKNVINEAIRLEKSGVRAPLAIETSGHAAFRDNYFLDDGAYLAARVIIEAARARAEGRDAFAALATLREAREEADVRVTFKTPDFAAYGARAIRGVAKAAAERFRPADDDCEGVRVYIDEYAGWFQLRMSVHDPVMPVRIESGRAGGARAIARILAGLLDGYGELDAGALRTI